MKRIDFLKTIGVGLVIPVLTTVEANSLHDDAVKKLAYYIDTSWTTTDIGRYGIVITYPNGGGIKLSDAEFIEKHLRYRMWDVELTRDNDDFINRSSPKNIYLRLYILLKKREDLRSLLIEILPHLTRQHKKDHIKKYI